MSIRLLVAALLTLAAASLGASGCYLAHQREAPSAPACPPGYWCRPIAIRATDSVDLLFVIDNSSSMTEEQASLVRELPRFVRILTTGDRDGDGGADFTPVGSLHVGVVTTDLGGGPVGAPTCPIGFGDDGIMRSASGVAGGCPAFPSGVFDFRADRDDIDTFVANVGCVALVGTRGCGFEQQLEAPLKAITPWHAPSWAAAGYEPPRFLSLEGDPEGSPGSSDAPANRGFVRPDSVLAVVLVTDEDDCSVADYRLFSRDDPELDSVPLNLRCDAFGDPERGFLRPIQRYVDGFVGLRADPSRFVFAAITGIPPDTEEAALRGDYQAVLDAPSMQPVPDAAGVALEPSCSYSDGVATPPVRIVEAARAMAERGATVSLSSICSPTFLPAVDRLVDRLAATLLGACLPMPLAQDEDGLVDCELFELTPPSRSCGSVEGRAFDHSERDARGDVVSACRIEQRDPTRSAGPGWYYDDASVEARETCGAGTPRVALTDGTPLPPPGTRTELRCRL